MPEPLEEEIEKLLQELRAEEAYRRERAAQSLAKLGVNDERISSTLEIVATQDLNEYVRQIARNALLALEHAPPVRKAPPSHKVYDTYRKLAADKTDEFIIGFAGWFVINSLILSVMELSLRHRLRSASSVYIGLIAILDLRDSDPFYVIGGWLVFLINITALIYLSFTRRNIALGVVTAFLVSFLFVLICAFLSSVAML